MKYIQRIPFESCGGQLLKEITKGQPRHHTSHSGSVGTLPEGITHKQSHEAQQLSKNPELIEEVINEAVLAGVEMGYDPKHLHSIS